MNWLMRLISGSPSNDTSAEEMEEMVFNDPEGDDYLMNDTGEDPAVDTGRALDAASEPAQDNQGGGFLGWLFGR